MSSPLGLISEDAAAYLRLAQIAHARQRRTLERLQAEKAELEWRLINLERKYLLTKNKT